MSANELFGETAPAPLTGERRRILVAQADRINQQVLRRLLDLLGHDTEIANTGREALVRWRAGGVDLLLMDLKMPDMDGHALARTLRLVEATKGLARTPIVALSADAPRRDLPLGRRADIEETLAKRVQAKALQAVLARCLPKTRPTAPAVPMARRGPQPPVDLDVLHRMVGTDPAVVREILLDYLESAREQADELRRAYRKGDVRQVGATVHKLKSAALAVGALALGELCAEMEMPAHSDFGTAELEHARFERVFDAAVAQIEAYLERMQP